MQMTSEELSMQKMLTDAGRPPTRSMSRAWTLRELPSPALASFPVNHPTQSRANLLDSGRHQFSCMLMDEQLTMAPIGEDPQVG